ncbi:MAG: glycine betaine/L-proline ABC transporter ATP-binding protein, partial [Polaromonas sp.]
IIRTEMQSELLRLQKVKRRTIVFISHDLDEAMRIGDRIAIMKDGQVVQVGTPDDILRNPADDYVRSFVRGVDASAVFKAGDIARKSQIVVSEHPSRGSRAALKMLEDQDRDYAYVVDASRQYLGMVSADSLRSALDGHAGPLGLAHAYLPDVRPIAADDLVSGLFGQVAQAPFAVPVVAEDGSFKGAISKTTLLKFLDRDTPHVPAH